MDLLTLSAARRPVRRWFDGGETARSPGRLRGLMLDRVASERREENNFDLLRLFAAVLVLFAHSFDLLGLDEPIVHAFSWGDLGVLIFFSISGFLVTRSWDYNPRLLAFGAKRALRLVPGLFVSLLVVALVLGPLVSSVPPGTYFADTSVKGYVLNNLILQSDYQLIGVFAHNVYPTAVNGSLWTLPVEVKAYFLLAVVGAVGVLVRFRPLILVFSFYAVIAMFPSGRLWLPGGVHYTAFLLSLQMPATTVAAVGNAASTGSYTIYTVYVAAFGLGAALYVLRRVVPIAWPLAVVAFAAVVYAIATQSDTTGLYIITFSVPYLVLWISYRTHRFVRLPGWWGDYSYGIYIYAFPIQQTLSQLLAPISGYLLFVLALIPTLALAALSWTYVEKPMLRLKSIAGGSTAEVTEPIVAH